MNSIASGPATGPCPGTDRRGLELCEPLEDPGPRSDVAVAHPAVTVDYHEIGGEQDLLGREPEDAVAERVPAAVRERLRRSLLAGEGALFVERLVGETELERFELRP